MTNDQIIASWAIGMTYALMVSLIVLNAMTQRGDK